MKKSVIFGKRQIVLAMLILALGAAVFLNWKFSGIDGNLDLTGALNSSKYIGDAQYVNNPSTTVVKSEDDYFAKTRSDRAKARADALAMLKEVMDDVKADANSKANVSAEATKLAKNVESENAVETLIKAKGFKDCVAIISGENINVVVKTNGLLASESLQIQDIVTTQTKILPKNIKIIESK
ncbi:MAG: hypothetical protein BGN88_01705 [Clostridiales bacterium 43-6]|nr:MAG: hypothetical protein BGN88_01705 [Clostridiales bacterium 43-6]